MLRLARHALRMNPAPGYEPIMPQDLLRFVVESELGLSLGIYSQVAEGRDAETFHHISSWDENHREAARYDYDMRDFFDLRSRSIASLAEDRKTPGRGAISIAPDFFQIRINDDLFTDSSKARV